VKITAPGGQGIESRGQNIEPGGTFKIVVSMSTRGYTKTLNKHIKIQTNDPEAGLVKLTMEAQVHEVLSVAPRLVNFGKVYQGSTQTRALRVKTKGKDPITISQITAKPDTMVALSSTKPFTLNPGEERQFELTFNPGTSKGHTGGYISLFTNIEYLPKKIIRVRAQVVEEKKP
jgi:hypothetical protein